MLTSTSIQNSFSFSVLLYLGHSFVNIQYFVEISLLTFRAR